MFHRDCSPRSTRVPPFRRPPSLHPPFGPHPLFHQPPRRWTARACAPHPLSEHAPFGTTSAIPLAAAWLDGGPARLECSTARIRVGSFGKELHVFTLLEWCEFGTDLHRIFGKK